ncbi:hypothetical protein M2372_002262 [Chryseobacterium sp. BIGb0232]|nr:hypothetical protein [Chryseobacterium sp. BIGb0232]ROS17470.1 hypothetical protein EDF65_1840 [Chryseobacterium nakagawai]
MGTNLQKNKKTKGSLKIHFGYSLIRFGNSYIFFDSELCPVILNKKK